MTQESGNNGNFQNNNGATGNEATAGDYLSEELMKVVAGLHPVTGGDAILMQAVTDIGLGNSPENTANLIIELLIESGQVSKSDLKILLNTPTEFVVMAIVEIQMQGIRALQLTAPKFINELRQTVRAKLHDEPEKV